MDTTSEFLELLLHATDVQASRVEQPVDAATFAAAMKQISALDPKNITGISLTVRSVKPETGETSRITAVVGRHLSVMYCVLAQQLFMQQNVEQAVAAEVPPSQVN